MSLGIVFKGTEGIVLAADTRITLTAIQEATGGPQTLIPAFFDNGSKILTFESQKWVSAITYGLGAIGGATPRTAQSFLPELDQVIIDRAEGERINVRDFAAMLSEFYTTQWNALMPEDYEGPDMVFLIGGYDPTDLYGQIYEVKIPSAPEPSQWNQGDDNFGAVWGGQLEFTNRLIHGFDPNVPEIIRQTLDLDDDARRRIHAALTQNVQINIPYQFLSLQDSIDFVRLLIDITINIQKFYVGVRGVGGNVDIVAVTKSGGLKIISKKEINGERTAL